MPWQVGFLLAVTICISTVSIGCASLRNATDRVAAAEARRLVRLLENPERRDAAACRLLALRRYRGEPRYKEEPCERISGAVNHVIVAPQDTGPPMYVVFRHWDFDVDGIGPRQSRGPFVLFDGEGYLVPVFGAANYLDGDSAVFAYAGDARRAIAHIILHASGKNEKEWTAQVLHVVPVTPSQQSVLSVIVGPPTYGFNDECNGFYWGSRIRDLDGDGVSEIEIGPWLNAQGAIGPKAVYRWSKETGRFDGPPGSVEAGFMRLEGQPVDRSCCPYFKAIEQFALSRAQLSTPGDPSAVRRSKCESFKTTLSGIPGESTNR